MDYVLYDVVVWASGLFQCLQYLGNLWVSVVLLVGLYALCSLCVIVFIKEQFNANTERCCISLRPVKSAVLLLNNICRCLSETRSRCQES